MKTENYSNPLTVRSLKRLFEITAFLFLAVFILAGCSDSKTISWREQVKLSDGEVIVVECANEYQHGYYGFVSGWLFQNAQIKIDFPSSHTTIMWKKNLQPLALDMDKQGDIYLVTTIQTNQGYIDYPKAKEHVAFKHREDGVWEQIPIETVPPEMKPNMLIAPFDTFSKLNYSTDQEIDLATKEKLNSDPRFSARYRSWASK